MANTIWADEMYVGQKIWVEKPSDDDPDYIVLIPAEIVEVLPKFVLYMNENDACDGFYRPGIHNFRYWDEKPTMHERWPSEY